MWNLLGEKDNNHKLSDQTRQFLPFQHVISLHGSVDIHFQSFLLNQALIVARWGKTTRRRVQFFVLYHQVNSKDPLNRLAEPREHHKRKQQGTFIVNEWEKGIQFPEVRRYITRHREHIERTGKGFGDWKKKRGFVSEREMNVIARVRTLVI